MEPDDQKTSVTMLLTVQVVSSTAWRKTVTPAAPGPTKKGKSKFPAASLGPLVRTVGAAMMFTPGQPGSGTVPAPKPKIRKVVAPGVPLIAENWLVNPVVLGTGS